MHGDAPSARGPEPPLAVDFHAVGRTASLIFRLVKEQHSFAERKVNADVVAPDQARLRIADVERGFIGSEGEAVGLGEALGGDEVDRTSGIDSIDAREGQLRRLSRAAEAGCAPAIGAVGGVRKENGPGRVHDQVIRAIEGLAVPAVGQGHHAGRVAVRAA